MKIDAHQHFWRYDPEAYSWITDEMQALRRDFLPEVLGQELRDAGVSGTVAVQARQRMDETTWLLDLAETTGFIRGVVGWIPLADDRASDIIAKCSEARYLVGARHVLQDEPAEYFSDAAFNRGVSALTRYGLTYDVLINWRQLDSAVALVDRHPYQIFVIDHCAKPPLRTGQIASWAEGIRRLAERPNTCCKLSGLVTEADWNEWSSRQLQPVLDTVLRCFGAERLMYASDWPVCTLAASYSHWHATMIQYTARLSRSEQQAIWGRTAHRVYDLDGTETGS